MNNTAFARELHYACNADMKSLAEQELLEMLFMHEYVMGCVPSVQAGDIP